MRVRPLPQLDHALVAHRGDRTRKIAFGCPLGENRQGLQGRGEVSGASLTCRSKPLGQPCAALLGRVVLHGDGERSREPWVDGCGRRQQCTGFTWRHRR